MIPNFNILTEEQVKAVHEQSMRIMEEVGVEFGYEPALNIFRQQGLRVEGERVYFKRDFVEGQINKAPAQFTLHARNPEHNLICGGDNIIYMPGYGAPFVIDAEGHRMDGSMEHYNNFVKLAGASKNLHMTGGNIVEPVEIDNRIRHLRMMESHILNSDKCFMGSASGREKAEDSIELAAILFGGRDVIREKPVLICLVNSITPLKYDDRMLGALMAYAEAKQPVVIAALVMAGATGPATLAGSLAVQNAEVLAGISLAQSINPGTPVVYGSTSSSADMQTGSLAIGTPENALFTSASAQLARYYGVPSRGGGGLTDAKTVDAQAGYESMHVLMAASVAGVNFVLHTAGILQYYSAMSYEKFIVDDEIAGMVLWYLKGIDFDEDKFAVGIISDVGPGGHFLTQLHTLQNFRTQLRRPQLSDRSSYDSWAAEKRDTLFRARAKWQEILANYEPPAIDQGIKQAIEEFIAKKSS